MAQVISLYPNRYASLNVRSLLVPIFFARKAKHPDSSRQTKARRRELDRFQARGLKAVYVPLCKVDRTVYLQRVGTNGNGHCIVDTRTVLIEDSRTNKYRRKLREQEARHG